MWELVVIRNHSGVVIDAFVRTLRGNFLVKTSELLVIYESLLFAFRLGLHDDLVESDVVNVVYCIQEKHVVSYGFS